MMTAVESGEGGAWAMTRLERLEERKMTLNPKTPRDRFIGMALLPTLWLRGRLRPKDPA